MEGTATKIIRPELFKMSAILIWCLLCFNTAWAQFSITEIGSLPVRISNNAVCEGFVNGTPYLFSFGGIDSTKIYSGIHLKSFRYNIETGEATRLPDLPDTNGKIACAASRIGNIIYISGGYSVFSNGSEVSSNKMHRYDIQQNIFLPDGMDIPVATDDHVQAVWRDSLIYLVTGWNNVTNIPHVQIYDPKTDLWTQGTPVPNNNNYKSFGASGVIASDTIYYFGGASSGAGFNIQNQLRKGVINPESPDQIQWTISIPDPAVNGYRMACTVVRNEVHWIGGSNITYNFNGIAYNGSGGVPPSNRDLYFQIGTELWEETIATLIPMDLRGIACIQDTVKYLAGGMLENQQVTNKIFKLEWKNDHSSSLTLQEPMARFHIYPNPFSDRIFIEGNIHTTNYVRLQCFSISGHKVYEAVMTNSFYEIPTEVLKDGMYILKLTFGQEVAVRKVLKKTH